MTLRFSDLAFSHQHLLNTSSRTSELISSQPKIRLYVPAPAVPKEDSGRTSTLAGGDFGGRYKCISIYMFSVEMAQAKGLTDYGELVATPLH